MPVGGVVLAGGSKEAVTTRDGRREFSEGKQVIDGLECRVWSNRRMGLHPRELNLLAAALEAAGSGADSIGDLRLGSRPMQPRLRVSDEA